jgi:type VI secretion system protein ImpG
MLRCIATAAASRSPEPEQVREELLPYYERELTFIRQMASEFAGNYPKVAGRLQLEPNTCEDPHVERLIEAFALLCGRVHHKLDDEFPEITEALLDALYPHYLRPVPSQAIAQFQLDASQSAVTAAIEAPAGTVLHSRPENGRFCSFRTCYPVALWPLRVTAASLSPVNRFSSPGLPSDAAAVIRIQMECLGGLRFGSLPVKSLRFYLNGESAAVHTLYEVLFLRALRVALHPLPARDAAVQAVLSAASLRQVGFDEAEGMLPYSDRSFLGYRLIQEYFTFPEKFLFFDLTGLDQISRERFGSAFEILIPIAEPPDAHRLAALEQAVGADTFQLGCTPIVNLFERIAEPVRVTHTKTEYRIVADQHRQASTEVYSVDRVTSAVPYLEEPRVYEPFYSLRHGAQDEKLRRFWFAHRRPSFRKKDNGTEVYLSLVDLDFRPAAPPAEILSVRVTCTNRDQASRLDLPGEFGELEPEAVALLRARCLRKPTAAVRPPLRRGLQWRLISHLSLNHLSIVEKGRDALQEILRLYGFPDDPAVRQQIAGIVDVSSRAAIGRVVSETGVAFCRGSDVTIDFDEEQFVGTGVFLLSSVLYRFLGLYSALNSFSRLTVRTRKGVLKQWPPLAGEQILL